MIEWREEWRLWWPSYDANADGVHAYVMKRISDAVAAIPYVDDKSCCVQAGGHVGLWPLALSRHFKLVRTFEPDEGCYQALVRNMGQANILASRNALGSSCGQAVLKVRTQSGSSTLLDVETKPGDDWKAVSRQSTVSVVSIDSLELPSCGLLVLDVEGGEGAALKGAAETIIKYRPVIHVEELKDSHGQTGRYLKSLGYRNRLKKHNDTIWTR